MQMKQENKDQTLLLAIQAAIEQNTREVRQQRVILEEDVAALYEVGSECLRRQVQQNKRRFPYDFMFRLTKEEQKVLCGEITKGDPLPYAFTEKGILMAGGILDTKRAVQIHIQVIDYFVNMYKEAMKADCLLSGMDDAGANEIFKVLEQLLEENNRGE